MACSKAEDLINQLIEATLKLLDFGLNILDALRVQKLLTIRNKKIGLISDDICLPECSLKFSLNFDLMMFNKLLRNACIRARATLNELRVCRLRYPNAPLVLEPKTKVKFQKLQKKIQEFDQAVKSDKMIARRDLRDFREISIIFSQLEHDLKLLICSLECASTMKDTVLFAAPITDVMTVLSIVLNRLERLAQKAEIDEKINVDEQHKIAQEQKFTSPSQSTPVHQEQPSNLSTPIQRQLSPSPSTKNRTKDVRLKGKNTNRTREQHRYDITAMIAAANQQNMKLNQINQMDYKHEKNSNHNDLSQTIQSDQSLKESESIHNNNKPRSKLPRHINRHYSSIKSHHQKSENLPDEIPSNHHHQIKEFHHDFIRKWTDDVRHIYAQNHLIPSSHQMIPMDLIQHNRHRQKSKHHHHHHARSSSVVNEFYKTKRTEEQSSSTSLSSIIENQLKNPNDNIECKIS